MEIRTQLLTGQVVASNLDAIASLRLDIFREFPYLYAGRREDELKYLQHYADTADAFALTALAAENVIGAATGMPLAHEDRQLTAPFSASAYRLDELYYIGELLFYPAYRNQGLGLRLLAEAEQRVRSLGTYRFLTCVTVVRPETHPLRPADYRPIDRFLAHTGFSLLPGVTTSLNWREIDGVRHDHLLQFWLYELG